MGCGRPTQSVRRLPIRSWCHGKHMRNGWKNAGLPWGYDFHLDLMWVTTEE